jgi:ubiquinone/menaquinone biosynthesis C-methylase UbiE
MESDVKRQIDFYVKRAGRFDRSFWSLGSRENRNHLKKLAAVARAIGCDDPARSGTRSVLEVGTGTGLHAVWLLERGVGSYAGVDVSEAMLDIARGRLSQWSSRVRLTVGDAQRLPFKDGEFDSAFSSATLHHLGDAALGIRELARVVRPGGLVAAIEPNWKFPSVLLYSAMTREEWNTFRINPARLAQWAAEAGLEDVTVTNLLYTPPRPRRLAPLFDRIDRGAARIPALRRLSINVLVSGRRPGA